MENGFNMLGEGIDPQDKKDELFNTATIHNQDQYVTSSAKVKIKLSPKSELFFQGVVKDDNNRVLEGAAVMVFACSKDGDEKLLGYTFTDKKGRYFAIITEPGYNELDGFKVRAGKDSLTPERIGYPVNCGGDALC